MQTIATDVPDCQSVRCLSGGFTQLWCAKTAEGIEVLFGVKTWGPRNIVLDPHGEREGKRIRCSFCQITLDACCILWCFVFRGHVIYLFSVCFWSLVPAHRLLGKTRLRNDLLGVEWVVKPD